MKTKKELRDSIKQDQQATKAYLTQHTPTPWKFEESTMTLRSAPSNYWLATFDSFDGAINNKANAAFIVRAVNSHEALLEAVKKALKYVQRAEPIDCQLEVDLKDTIAQAEGK